MSSILFVSKFFILALLSESTNACFGGCGLGLGMMPGFGGGLGFGGGFGGLYPGMGYGAGVGGLGLGGYGAGLGCMGGCGGFGYGAPLCCSPYMGYGAGFIGKRSVHWHLKASRARQRVKHRRDARLTKIKVLKKMQSRLLF